MEFITDRTQSDVDRLKLLRQKNYDLFTDSEKQEWDNNLKGAYNASDLNRVESAVEELAFLLHVYLEELKNYAESKKVIWNNLFEPNYDPYEMSIVVKKDWTAEDVPTQQDMERYLNNVIALRRSLNYDTDELPESMNNLTWQGANAIEKALKNLETAINVFYDYTKNLIDNTVAAWFYSNEVYSGEV